VRGVGHFRIATQDEVHLMGYIANSVGGEGKYPVTGNSAVIYASIVNTTIMMAVVQQYHYRCQFFVFCKNKCLYIVQSIIPINEFSYHRILLVFNQIFL